ncbi:hypothetical protein [Jannaschia seohaensis]|uniref:Uncharacterized protein n=1 Tax=Jannaschia seohaensis TaxID=475081 RepID=A0A2Y9BBR0_9RHOB|nr:hypothetical protein [Jannaschia seohaensis]PWJ10339.1 hypothetical protein BCF38_12418 [Jannaschia seohaensis]SSA51739.1 hypothetical protein SAMN05421539_12418 [Jannaschia seohaensis]
MRVPQPEGCKGSLKWIQRAVERRPDLLNLPNRRRVEWLSPLRSDDWAEYSDEDSLRRLGLSDHGAALRAFWPRRGPQWDALGHIDGAPVLVEAKAHLAEFLSPATQAGPSSRPRIEAAFGTVQRAEGLRPPADWTRCLYQLANRIAHLWFMRSRGLDATLLLVGFVGDRDMSGPEHPETWASAEAVAFHALGLSNGHTLRRSIVSVHPHVQELE